jgi:hypothetical protein
MNRKPPNTPEPAWWAEARLLRPTTCKKQIAIILGKSYSAVLIALNPKTRARKNRQARESGYNKEYWQKLKLRDTSTELPKAPRLSPQERVRRNAENAKRREVARTRADDDELLREPFPNAWAIRQSK